VRFNGEQQVLWNQDLFNLYLWGCFGFDVHEKGNKSCKEASFQYAKTLEGNVVRGFFGRQTAFAVAA